MKALIYFDKNLLEPIGGPTGYLYNIYQEALREKISDIEFLDRDNAKRKMKIKKMYKKMPKFIQKKYKEFKRRKNGKQILEQVFSDIPRKSVCDLNQYDIVHFHSTFDLYMVKDSLENFNGTIVLTSHSPKILHKEIIEDRMLFENISDKTVKDKLNKMEIIDEYAFNKADFIIFPCEEAEEPYYHSWTKYAEFKKNNEKKYIYIPTGIVPIKIKEEKKDIRKYFNIPDDAFVISYVGRHNEVKGYDQLKVLGEKILKKYENVYFLIAGTEKPLEGLKNQRWIEVGWTDKPHEIINASDLFILPNKETYFDLILLEVLSIGKTVLMTETGGNKYFKKYEDSGIFYYDRDNIDEALERFSTIYYSDNDKLGEKNKKIFDENFTIEIFVKRYIEELKKIAEREKKNNV